MTRTLEMDHGRIVCKYDAETGEIVDLCDWSGNEVSLHWQKVAEEAVLEAMDGAA